MGIIPINSLLDESQIYVIDRDAPFFKPGGSIVVEYILTFIDKY